MKDVIIVRDIDGHTQRVILQETHEGVRFWITGRERSARLVKDSSIREVKNRLRTMNMGAFA